MTQPPPTDHSKPETQRESDLRWLIVAHALLHGIVLLALRSRRALRPFEHAQARLLGLWLMLGPGPIWLRTGCVLAHAATLAGVRMWTGHDLIDLIPVSLFAAAVAGLILRACGLRLVLRRPESAPESAQPAAGMQFSMAQLMVAMLVVSIAAAGFGAALNSRGGDNLAVVAAIMIASMMLQMCYSLIAAMGTLYAQQMSLSLVVILAAHVLFTTFSYVICQLAGWQRPPAFGSPIGVMIEIGTLLLVRNAGYRLRF